MEYYPTLHELLEHSPQSKRMFDNLSQDAQIALQHQRQNIHTYADLQKIGTLFEQSPHWW